MAADEGSGATITFGTSGVSLLVTSIQGQGIEWTSMPTMNLATTGGRPYKRSDTYEPGTIAVGVQWDPTLGDDLIGSAADETITITYPDGSTEASSGHIQRFDSGRCENGQIMDGTVTVKRSGDVTFTDAV